MKLWERIVERRLRYVTTVLENQFGFMLGRSSIAAISLLRSLIEKCREREKNLRMVPYCLRKSI